MKYEQEQMYAPPTVEIVEVAMEQGFTISGWGDDSDDSEFGEPYH